MTIEDKYREAARDIGELFCWCVEHLKKFPPLEGEWIGDVKRRLLEVEALRRRLLSAAGDDLCRLTQESGRYVLATECQYRPLQYEGEGLT